MNRPLRVGDLCVTVNTNHPGCNEGVLVTIVKIEPLRQSREEATPYLVRRLDGLPHVSTTDTATGAQRWCKCYEAWCASHKLKRVDDKEPAKATRVKREVTA